MELIEFTRDIMKKLYILLFVSVVSTIYSAEKYVIGYQEATGLFYSYLGVVNNLLWCKKNNKVPVVYWGPHSYYYEKKGYHGKKNVWEYYFEPVSTMQYKRGDMVHNANAAPDGTRITPVEISLCNKYDELAIRNEAHAIIKEHIHLRPYLTQKINTFYQTHMAGKKTIGIHLRGTDKKIEVIPVNIQEMLNDANKLAEEYPGCQFFIATDEEKLLHLAKTVLKGKVINYNSQRSRKGKAVHRDSKFKHPAKLGEQVIIEATLLSRCDLFLHTCSSVSTAALFLNPILEHKRYKQKNA